MTTPAGGGKDDDDDEDDEDDKKDDTDGGGPGGAGPPHPGGGGGGEGPQPPGVGEVRDGVARCGEGRAEDGVHRREGARDAGAVAGQVVDEEGVGGRGKDTGEGGKKGPVTKGVGVDAEEGDALKRRDEKGKGTQRRAAEGGRREGGGVNLADLTVRLLEILHDVRGGGRWRKTVEEGSEGL